MNQKLMNERHTTIVNEIVDSIRQVILRNKVTNTELWLAIKFLQETGRAEHEMPLLLQAFFESTTCRAKNEDLKGSSVAIEGPFYLEGAPEIPFGGEIKTLGEEDGEPIIVRGKITDVDGNPLENVRLDLWHSTPKGTYSGVHPGIPADHYRAKMTTGADGLYEVRTTKPVPYQIPHDGNTGELLIALGGHPWRPAHLHFKARGEGLLEHISQVYFEGEEYVDDDCCTGVCDELVLTFTTENGVKVITKDFVLDAA